MPGVASSKLIPETSSGSTSMCQIPGAEPGTQYAPPDELVPQRPLTHAPDTHAESVVQKPPLLSFSVQTPDVPANEQYKFGAHVSALHGEP